MKPSTDEKVAAKRRILRAINRFKRASIELSWIGSKRASEHHEILREHKLARDHLDKVIEELING